ncbi:hypothetical protein D3C76_1355560 [compost metagenome]
MLLALELQAGQLQGGVEADRALQLAGFGEALLEVDVAHTAQLAAQVLPAPLLFQLAAVVVAPAGPARQALVVPRQPVFELRPHRTQRLGGVDVVLADMRQFAAEGGQHGAPLRPHEALEVVQLAAVVLADQGGADLDDFHFLDGPSAFLGGGFQVDYQPVGHGFVLDLPSSMEGVSGLGKPLC